MNVLMVLLSHLHMYFNLREQFLENAASAGLVHTAGMSCSY